MLESTWFICLPVYCLIAPIDILNTQEQGLFVIFTAVSPVARTGPAHSRCSVNTGRNK